MTMTIKNASLITSFVFIIILYTICGVSEVFFSNTMDHCLFLNLASFFFSSVNEKPEGSWLIISDHSLFLAPQLLHTEFPLLSSQICMSCSCLELFCLSLWGRNPVCDSPLDSICNPVSTRSRCGAQRPNCLKQYSFILAKYTLIMSFSTTYDKKPASNNDDEYSLAVWQEWFVSWVDSIFCRDINQMVNAQIHNWIYSNLMYSCNYWSMEN